MIIAVKLTHTINCSDDAVYRVVLRRCT